MQTVEPIILGEDALADLRGWLRVDEDHEDPLLLALLAGALRQCEGYASQIFLRRQVKEMLTASADWQRLSATPVSSISQVAALGADGAETLLPIAAYAIDIDAHGDGWVRITSPASAPSKRVQVTASVGLALDWVGLPEPVRLAALRLTGYLHAHRDGDDDEGPPAAVAALLRPWRRMRIR
jgi:uncharacterized phiE125 gp8 family phage protein